MKKVFGDLFSEKSEKVVKIWVDRSLENEMTKAILAVMTEKGEKITFTAKEGFYPTGGGVEPVTWFKISIDRPAVMFFIGMYFQNLAQYNRPFEEEE